MHENNHKLFEFVRQVEWQAALIRYLSVIPDEFRSVSPETEAKRKKSPRIRGKVRLLLDAG